MTVAVGFMIPFNSHDNMKKVYAGSVEVLTDSLLEDIKFVVKGNLPSPAYSLSQISVRLVKNKIDIIPWAQFDQHAMVSQVIVPFQDTISVMLEKKGKYEVRLHGLGGIKSQTIQIAEKKID